MRIEDRLGNTNSAELWSLTEGQEGLHLPRDRLLSLGDLWRRNDGGMDGLEKYCTHERNW